MTFNKVIIGGHLTRDPELRYTPKGTPIAKIGVAINRTWTTEAGEKKEDVSFVDCAAFGKTAENIAKFLKKGNPILIDGRLDQETWTDKQTQKERSKIGVIIETFQFVGGKKETEK